MEINIRTYIIYIHHIGATAKEDFSVEGTLLRAIFW